MEASLAADVIGYYRTNSLAATDTLRDRIARLPRDLRGVDICSYLSEDFDNSLMYLPSALRFVSAVSPDRELAVEAIGRFTGAWIRRLTSEGLLDSVRHALNVTLELWSHTYCEDVCPMASGQDIAALREVLAVHPPFFILFESLLESRRDDTSFFELLLSEWAERAATPDANAFVLDFFLGVRCAIPQGLLSRNSFVLHHAFDRAQLCSKWTIAGPLMSKVCSKGHYEAIKDWLELD